MSDHLCIGIHVSVHTSKGECLRLSCSTFASLAGIASQLALAVLSLPLKCWHYRQVNTPRLCRSELWTSSLLDEYFIH